MKYDVLKLCKEQNGRYEVDPAVMFPATIARIQEWLAGADVPEIVGGDYEIAARWLKEARAIPKEAWELALEPRGDFVEPDPEEQDLVDKFNLTMAKRAAALGYAESFFARAMSLTAGGQSVHLHIIKNEDYRR